MFEISKQNLAKLTNEQKDVAIIHLLNLTKKLEKEINKKNELINRYNEIFRYIRTQFDNINFKKLPTRVKIKTNVECDESPNGKHSFEVTGGTSESLILQCEYCGKIT